MERRFPDSLHFRSGERVHPLPAWARFYAEAGASMSQMEDRSTEKATLGLIVPVRSYVAAFCATGFVCTQMSSPPDEEDVRLHFEHLRSQPSGTPVIYLKNGRMLRGRLKPRREEIGVQIDNEDGGSRTLFIEATQKKLLRIGVRESAERALPMNQQGWAVRTPVSFIETVLPGRDAPVFLARSSLECAIIGQVNLLESEICDTRLVAKERSGDADELTGRLQDIIRVNRFTRTRENYRTEVWKSAGSDPPEMPGDSPPRVVLFDGAAGFLKWRDCFPEAHHVVILERSDRRFRNAVDQLKRASFTRSADLNLADFPDLPAGTELTGYWR